MRKQIEMLTMAGVDFIVLDTSNNVLYENVTAVLFDLLLEYQEAGWDVPRVVYYLGKHDLGADISVFKQLSLAIASSIKVIRALSLPMCLQMLALVINSSCELL